MGSFVHWLQQKLPGARIDSRYVGGPGRWPDFLMCVNGHELEVEVTCVVKYHHHTCGQPIAEPAVEASLDRLLSEVRNDALERGLLRGTYVVTLFGALIEELGAHKREIQRKMVAYVGLTRDAPHAEPEVVHVTIGVGFLEIQKIAGSGKALHISRFCSYRPVPALQEIRSELQKRIAAKRLTASGAVLLIGNAHPGAELSLLQRAYSELPVPRVDAVFHSVFACDRARCVPLRPAVEPEGGWLRWFENAARVPEVAEMQPATPAEPD